MDGGIDVHERHGVAMAPIDQGLHLGRLAKAALFHVTHPAESGQYLEYGNRAITEFDYAIMQA